MYDHINPLEIVTEDGVMRKIEWKILQEKKKQIAKSSILLQQEQLLFDNKVETFGDNVDSLYQQLANNTQRKTQIDQKQELLKQKMQRLDAFTGFGSVSIPGNTVSSTIQFDYLEFSNGDALNGYFNNSAAHRVWRYDEVHNLELNVIRQRVITACDSPWDVNWSAGLRWFRFEENFTFGAVAENQTWGDDGGIHEAYLQDDITNDMIGFQFGFESSYYLSGACRFFVAPQIGIYNNHIRNRFSLYRGDGTVAYEIEPDLDGTYPVNSSKDVLSFMTEIDFGFDWKFSRNWSARLGYRVLFISGIGLAEEQITPYAVDIPEIADIDHNATLILHGAFGGLTYNF